MSDAPAAQTQDISWGATSLSCTSANPQGFSKPATSGYALIVDGHIKNEFKTKEGADKRARELKFRFPMLQIKVYNAEAKISEEIAPA